jgi:hypothetical protein
VFGAELVVGYVFAWLVGKGKRVGARADGQVDEVLDAGVDRVGERLHELVAGKLHGDRAWERLTAEAGEGLDAPSPRTAQRVVLALEEAGDEDASFAALVEDLVRRLQAAGGVVSAGDGGVAVGGSVSIEASGGSVAAWEIRGGVSLGNPPVPDPSQG